MKSGSASVPVSRSRTNAARGIYSAQQYLRSADEMVELFADIPEAIANSVAIATACNLRLELGKAYLPEYPVPEEHSTDSYLRHVSAAGAGTAP